MAAWSWFVCWPVNCGDSHCLLQYLLDQWMVMGPRVMVWFYFGLSIVSMVGWLVGLSLDWFDGLTICCWMLLNWLVSSYLLWPGRSIDDWIGLVYIYFFIIVTLSLVLWNDLWKVSIYCWVRLTGLVPAWSSGTVSGCDYRFRLCVVYIIKTILIMRYAYGIFD